MPHLKKVKIFFKCLRRLKTQIRHAKGLKGAGFFTMLINNIQNKTTAENGVDYQKSGNILLNLEKGFTSFHQYLPEEDGRTGKNIWIETSLDWLSSSVEKSE